MNNCNFKVAKFLPYVLAWLLLLVPAVGGSAATNPGAGQADYTQLNSDGIAAKFGSYGVEVIRQDDDSRISSLYSVTDGVKTTRTLAVVLFNVAELEPLEAEHDDILDGASIGTTFRNAGWQIQKSNIYLGELRGAEQAPLIRRWMGTAGKEILAMHVYDFYVTKDGRPHKYATIAEIHDPDYLTLLDLQMRYADEAAQLQRLDPWSAEALQAVFTVLNR